MDKRSELSPFEQLYSDHSNMVYNLCLNYLKNEELAADISQDVFIKIHAKLEHFKGDSSLKTWVYRITINECLDYLRAQKRKKRFGLIFSFSNGTEPTSQSLTTFNHPGVQLEYKEISERIFSAIDKLPDRQKTALLLQVTEGLSHQEIAEIMQISPKAVESIIGRARHYLKKIFPTRKG